MHELGLCSSIVDAIEHRAGVRQVPRVRVRVGRLHHVHPRALPRDHPVGGDLALLQRRQQSSRCPRG
jgi:hypothetical protein